MNEKARPKPCAVQKCLSVLGGRWKILIIHELFSGTLRFNELSRAVPGVSQRTLTSKLRELETDGVVVRKAFAEIPPRVEYSLSELGMSLKPIIDAMHDWGTRHQAAGS